MIAPAAHTSKGLAKAFVSSAGGKGPENRDTPAPLSPTLRDARLPSEEQRIPEQGNKDYNPLRSGVAAHRDPSRLCLYIEAVRLTCTPLTLPYHRGLLFSWASGGKV